MSNMSYAPDTIYNAIYEAYSKNLHGHDDNENKKRVERNAQHFMDACEAQSSNEGVIPLSIVKSLAYSMLDEKTEKSLMKNLFAD